jgi:glutamyl-tRNA synthetase
VAKQPAFAALLDAALEAYATVEWEAGALKESTLAAGASVGVTQLGKAQAPIRLAVTGRSVGPPLFESLELLGRERTLVRLATALAKVRGALSGG